MVFGEEMISYKRMFPVSVQRIQLYYFQYFQLTYSTDPDIFEDNCRRVIKTKTERVIY